MNAPACSNINNPPPVPCQLLSIRVDLIRSRQPCLIYPMFVCQFVSPKNGIPARNRNKNARVRDPRFNTGKTGREGDPNIRLSTTANPHRATRNSDGMTRSEHHLAGGRCHLSLGLSSNKYGQPRRPHGLEHAFRTQNTSAYRHDVLALENAKRPLATTIFVYSVLSFWLPVTSKYMFSAYVHLRCLAASLLTCRSILSP